MSHLQVNNDIDIRTLPLVAWYKGAVEKDSRPHLVSRTWLRTQVSWLGRQEYIPFAIHSVCCTLRWPQPGRVLILGQRRGLCRGHAAVQRQPLLTSLSAWANRLPLQHERLSATSDIQAEQGSCSIQHIWAEGHAAKQTCVSLNPAAGIHVPPSVLLLCCHAVGGCCASNQGLEERQAGSGCHGSGACSTASTICDFRGDHHSTGLPA